MKRNSKVRWRATPKVGSSKRVHSAFGILCWMTCAYGPCSDQLPCVPTTISSWRLVGLHMVRSQEGIQLKGTRNRNRILTFNKTLIILLIMWCVFITPCMVVIYVLYVKSILWDYNCFHWVLYSPLYVPSCCR